MTLVYMLWQGSIVILVGLRVLTTQASEYTSAALDIDKYTITERKQSLRTGLDFWHVEHEVMLQSSAI